VKSLDTAVIAGRVFRVWFVRVDVLLRAKNAVVVYSTGTSTFERNHGSETGTERAAMASRAAAGLIWCGVVRLDGKNESNKIIRTRNNAIDVCVCVCVCVG
jgi:hypothetical protein